jgi:CHAT domain-containing protein/Tfp pilus assembly protein PilF
MHGVHERRRSGRRVVSALLCSVALFHLFASSVQAGPREDCAALYRQGLQYGKQGNYAKAVDALGRASALGERALGPNSLDLADIFNSLAHSNFSLGRYADALSNLQRVLAIREKALPPSDPKVANSLNDLAFLDDQLGHYADAEALYRRAASLQEKLHGRDHPEFARVLNNLAVLYLHQARFAEAEPLLKQVVATWQKTLGPNNPDVATSLNNLAGVYDREGRYGEAEPLMMQALAIREKVAPNGPEVAQSLINLAHLYGEEGRFADAEPFTRRALALQEKALGPVHPDVATSLMSLATAYSVQGRYADADPLMKRALSIREKALGAGHPDVAQAINNLAGMYDEQGRYAEAEPLFKRALEIDQNALGADHPEVAGALHNIGFVETQQGRYAEAEPFMTRALAVREKALGADHPDVASDLNNLAFLYDSQGRFADALGPSRKAAAIVARRLDRTEDDTSDANAHARQDSRKLFLRLVHLLWNVLPDKANPPADLVDEAFRSAQDAGSIETAAAVSGMMARHAGGSDGLAELVRDREDLTNRWRKIDADLLKAVSQSPDKRDLAAEAALRKEQADLDGKLAADNAKLRASFPRFAELTAARPVGIADVQSVLGAGEVFADFALSEKESFLFVIRKQDAHFFRLDVSRDQVSDTVKALRAALLNDDPFDVAQSHDLYQKLFGPADALIAGAKNLIVVPDGALQSLPFSVLVTAAPPEGVSKTSDYQAVAWLIRRQAVTVQPAASSLVALRRFAAVRHGADPFAGFGDPILDGSGGSRGIDAANLYRGKDVIAENLKRLPRLPETADELRMEAKALGASETSIHLGKDATVTTVRSLDLSNVRVVSFATHGLIAGELPKLGEPALVLTPPVHPTPDDDGLLRSSEVADLKLDADFVILSACNTAAASGEPGAEGLSGLAKAFFYAGAHSLLVSHWPVDSEATVKLTTGLVRETAEHPEIGRAEALRHTMLAMIERDGGKSPDAHPFLWAPFILAGEGGANNQAVDSQHGPRAP